MHDWVFTHAHERTRPEQLARGRGLWPYGTWSLHRSDKATLRPAGHRPSSGESQKGNSLSESIKRSHLHDCIYTNKRRPCMHDRTKQQQQHSKAPGDIFEQDRAVHGYSGSTTATPVCFTLWQRATEQRQRARDDDTHHPAWQSKAHGVVRPPASTTPAGSRRPIMMCSPEPPAAAELWPGRHYCRKAF